MAKSISTESEQADRGRFARVSTTARNFVPSRGTSGHRARRRARGAVTIEALIVNGFFTVVLGGSIVLHRVYASHLAMVNEARLAAWQPALAGCGDKPEGDSAENMVTGAAESNEADVSMDGMESWMLVSTREQSRGKSVSVFGQPKQIGAKRSVACNESKSPDLGIKPLLQKIGGVFLRE
jgi:hypothetical protein